MPGDRYHFLTFLALASLLSCSNGERPQRKTTTVAREFAGIPNVSFEYYDVQGDDAEGIRRSMNAQRPTDGNDGQRVDALTRWTIDWVITSDSRGRCDLQKTRLVFRARVVLPRLADLSSRDPMLLSHWNEFLSGLIRHEAWHVRDAYTHLPDVEASIRASTCAEAPKAAAAAVQQIGQRHLDYDRRTRHGADEVIPFP